MKLLKHEKHILQHALGGEKQYRNNFVTSENSSDYKFCMSLVRKGLMIRRDSPDWIGSDYIFYVTEEGKKWAFED